MICTSGNVSAYICFYDISISDTWKPTIFISFSNTCLHLIITCKRKEGEEKDTSGVYLKLRKGGRKILNFNRKIVDHKYYDYQRK